MRRDRKVALALAGPDLVCGVGYRKVASRGVQKDRKAALALALAVRPHPGRRGDTRPNVEEDGPGMVLRRLDDPHVQIADQDMREGPVDKV
jgi:hypothetical protein